LQIQINAKQQAYAELVQSEQAQALQAISGAVAAVAKDKGLDLVVDGGGVLAGGQKLLDNGIDITNDVVKRARSRKDSQQACLRRSYQVAPVSRDTLFG
jgi:Skp family chaperone for outer membrane proteins